MPDAVPDALHHYAEMHTSPEPSLLQKINRETYVQVSQPHMLSGHLQGRLLSMISKLIRPAVILEVGTFTGYSAICLAEGLREGGVLHTIDHNDELADRCEKYFEEAGMAQQIILHTGDAADIIPSLAGPFDLVFLDADKPNYAKYFDLVIDRMPSGGVILADNVLYHMEVLRAEGKQSNNAKAISAFNRKVAADDRVESVMLTVRDGLFLIRKK